jgi:hypothetical protein
MHAPTRADASTLCGATLVQATVAAMASEAKRKNSDFFIFQTPFAGLAARKQRKSVVPRYRVSGNTHFTVAAPGFGRPKTEPCLPLMYCQKQPDSQVKED